MAKTNEIQLKRKEIPFFEGVNTLVGGNIAKKQELAMCENARSTEIGTIEKRTGYRRLGSDLSASANYGLYYFESSDVDNKFMYRVSKVGATTSIYYMNTSDVWTALAGGGTGLTAAKCSFTTAESCMFVVNGNDVNRYVSSDGTTVVTSATATGHLYNCPKAFKVNHYKDRLYVGDYYISTTRYKNGIMRSSKPLGIVALVDGDHDQPVTSLKVTDLKYIHSTDTLNLYRGGTDLGDITVTAKNADSNTLTISSFGTDIKSSDELWVNNTYSGSRVFRWSDNPESGEDVKQYDTFKLAGGGNDALTMLTNVGKVQLIANKNHMSIWDDYRLDPLDLGIGCVSSEAWVKAFGTLFFMGYDGVYATTGGAPQLISAKMQRLFNGATKAGLEAGAMGKKGLHIYASLGDVTLYNKDGSTDRVLSDVVIERNIRQENWYVFTGIDAKYFHNYYTSTDIERLEYCADDGEVYELLTGTKDNNANEIHFRIDSQPITLSNEFENIVYPVQVIIEADRGSAIQCFVKLDGGDWYEIQGEAVRGCNIMYVTSPNYDEKPARCRNIAVSIRESSKTICTISRVAIVYSDTYEEENYRKQDG